MRILVCDDKPEQCKVTIATLQAAGIPEQDITSLFGSELAEQLEKFFSSIHDFPNTFDIGAAHAAAPLLLTNNDLVLLDNNLASLDLRGARLTAEAIAGLIRAFAEPAYVVSLNKNPDVDFDLRYLVGDYSTTADLALNTEHLEEKALWTEFRESRTDRFQPWYWPTLPRAVANRPKQVDFVKAHLHEPILSSLHIPVEVAGELSREAIGALSKGANYEMTDEERPGMGESVGDVTFLEFFRSRNRSISVFSDRKALADSVVLSNSHGSLEVLSRVIAADIDYWIRRYLLAPQDILVDLPHLAVRMPFALTADASGSPKWNELVGGGRAPYGLEDQIFTNQIAFSQFQHEEWLPAPAFFWPLLRSSDEVNELFLTASDDWVRAAFLEDTSGFALLTDDLEARPKEFEAAFEGSWRRRYIGDLRGIHYLPISRLAM